MFPNQSLDANVKIGAASDPKIVIVPKALGQTYQQLTAATRSMFNHVA